MALFRTKSTKNKIDLGIRTHCVDPRCGMVKSSSWLKEDTDYNLLGTYLYRMLKHPSAILDDTIFGPFYLMNEDKDGIVDLTIADLKDILETSREDRNKFNLPKMELMMKTYLAIKIKFPELL